ncbi:ABC transporter transmembrane domain-containing protein [Nannocystaceae bacterium ST9]
MAAETTIDRPPVARGLEVPARVLELLGAAAGCELSPRRASEAAAGGAIHADDWVDAIDRASARAGMRVASFMVEGIDELDRLRELGTPALTRVGERWLVLAGAHGPMLDLTILDELGEQRRRLRPAALLDWLVAHTPAALPMRWLAVEPRQLLASVEGEPAPIRRLLGFARLERSDLGVVVVYAMAIGAATLAVPIAVQALVNTVATSAMLQPLVVLGLLLLFVLGFVAVLRVAQTIVVERIQQRLFARVAVDFARRLPRLGPAARDRFSGPELVNRFFEVVNLQKSAAALLIDGSALALQVAVGLLLLAFYHPWLLAFDLALIFGIVVVLLAGRGAMKTSLVESERKYAMAAWLEDVAGAPLRFADARSRSFADARAELLLRDWLDARGRHFRHLLRHVVGGIGLQVAASVGLLAIGGWLVIARQLTLGQLVAAELVVALIGAGLGKIGKYLENFYDAATAAAKLGKLLDLPLEPAGGDPLPAVERALAVELRERSTDEPTLTLEPGQRLGLIGCTVAHAELLDALYGLSDSPRVAVRLDGHEVPRLELESLRAQVWLVRGAELVAGSVLDNLDGRTIAGEGEDLGPLLDRVGLRSRLLGLAQGLATPLLPDASPLDRTDARRLALVRALAARPRLLLIDRGLDGLGLSATQRAALLDWIFDRQRPWTLIVASEDPELLARCDLRLELA